MPAYIIQYVFQSFFVAAEKPGLSLKITIAAGLTNAVLDWLLIAVIPMGLAGAAIASALGQLVGGIVPILYNFQLMKLAGENGIAAYGVIMYVNVIFMASYWGYSLGSAPIVSYHYGAGNHGELKNMFRKSMVLLAWAGASGYRGFSFPEKEKISLCLKVSACRGGSWEPGGGRYGADREFRPPEPGGTRQKTAARGLNFRQKKRTAPRQKDLPRIRCRRSEPSRDRPDRPASC